MTLTTQYSLPLSIAIASLQVWQVGGGSLLHMSAASRGWNRSVWGVVVRQAAHGVRLPFRLVRHQAWAMHQHGELYQQATSAQATGRPTHRLHSVACRTV